MKTDTPGSADKPDNGHDPLEKFIIAQQSDFAIALSEIKTGKKRSHWVWYIFPQIQGLGHSQRSVYYAINDMEEAGAYLNHPVLGKRLTRISRELLNLPSNDAYSIFGFPDDLKLQSCMTLFSLVPGSDPVFDDVIKKFFKGEKDEKTIRILRG
jgi:uncharacterized protein (DUF1810 family)